VQLLLETIHSRNLFMLRAIVASLIPNHAIPKTLDLQFLLRVRSPHMVKNGEIENRAARSQGDQQRSLSRISSGGKVAAMF